MRTLIADKAKQNPLLETFVSLVTDSTVYLFGAAILGLGNFVLVPLYTRQLTPAQFGIYGLIEVAILAFVIITQVGFGTSYLKWFADQGTARRGAMLGSTLAVSLLTSSLGGFALIALLVTGSSTDWLLAASTYIWILVPIVILENLQGLFLTDLRATRQAAFYSSSMVIRLLAIVGFTYWFMVVNDNGLAGLFWGRCAGDAVGVIILATVCLRSVRLRFEWALSRSMIRYGIPIVWSALAAIALDASGRYFLNRFSTLEQVGYYSAAIKVSGIFQVLVVQPFAIAWGGVMFQISKLPNARFIYSKALEYLFVFALSIALVLALFAPALISIFTTPSYMPAAEVLPIILLVRAINIMMYPAGIGIYLAGRTAWFPLLFAAGLVVNLAAGLLLTPSFGMFGAAWSWLLGWTVIIVSMAVVGHRYYALDYRWKAFVLPASAWIVFLSMQAILPPFKPSLLLQFSIAAIIALAATAFVLNDFRRLIHMSQQEKAI